MDLVCMNDFLYAAECKYGKRTAALYLKDHRKCIFRYDAAVPEFIFDCGLCAGSFCSMEIGGFSIHERRIELIVKIWYSR